MTWKETLSQWQSAKLPDYLQEELNDLSEEQLEDAFYQNLSFGTAGMRGILGVGSNRMNIFTVRQVTEALARYMDSVGEEAKKEALQSVLIHVTSPLNLQGMLRKCSVLTA